MNRSVIQPRIAIACGGTGGHVFPGLAVAGELRRRGCEVWLFVSTRAVDQQALRAALGETAGAAPGKSDQANCTIVTLPAVGLQSGQRLAFLVGLWRAWRAARAAFRQARPAAVLTMGGFTGVGPIWAGRCIGAKTFLHESNTIPGRANRRIARLVDVAFVGFAEAASRLRARRVVVTGTPVRPEFVPGAAAGARSELGLDPTRPVVLVMGGSQGASGINRLVMAALPALAARAPHWQWLHLTGPNDAAAVKSAYAAARVRAVVHEFFGPMHRALQAASAAVSRAGASTLAELAAVRVPALLVPFPWAADNHQWHNALAFARTGAARVLEEKDATPERFAEQLWELVENPETAERMRTALERWHAPDAAARVAEEICHAVAEARTQTVATARRAVQPVAPARWVENSDAARPVV
ncbi:MAG: UDP-N-acetylglucosamine--N-acetylmuramyl-(pentapeptide) pyrophosphoryl-undecaprenol N-acetylglucosamine transferase [Verrucomicrobiales bacterium]|nr:UDP-N-acetylglucosamine--N-acetylmuramyl-(pentapeptide) pyrophosphoryl-undecaprenol N-acetylglucosamine transferase [Verrucomicrobiales bacterium]